MILIGIGSNLPAPTYPTPRETCEAAIQTIAAKNNITLIQRSRWFESAPVPLSDQPWFINGVIQVQTVLEPHQLLTSLHDIEKSFGRLRREKNAPRTLDLDLLTFDECILKEGDTLILPHPRLHERGFVLHPLAELCPDWRHPLSGARVDELLARLPKEQSAHPLEDGIL